MHSILLKKLLQRGDPCLISHAKTRKREIEKMKCD